MASWPDFAAAQPGLAAGICSLVHQYGPGLGYLATVRPDGGPRVHPVSPIITPTGLYCFVIDSPKRRDLERDGRYALHAFPADDSDDEAYLSGDAWPVRDETLVRRLARQLRARPTGGWRLFEFGVTVAMLVRRGQVAAGSVAVGGGLAVPGRMVWRDPENAGGRRVRCGAVTRQRGGACGDRAEALE